MQKNHDISVLPVRSSVTRKAWVKSSMRKKL